MTWCQTYFWCIGLDRLRAPDQNADMNTGHRKAVTGPCRTAFSTQFTCRIVHWMKEICIWVCRYWLRMMTRSWEQNSDSVGTQFIGSLCFEWTPTQWPRYCVLRIQHQLLQLNSEKKPWIYRSLFIAHSLFYREFFFHTPQYIPQHHFLSAQIVDFNLAPGNGCIPYKNMQTARHQTQHESKD